MNTSNLNTDNLNVSNFYFTDDKFKNDVMLLKVDENYNITSFKIKDYIKNLTNVDYSVESDCDSIIDQKDLEHLLKEPFDY